MKARKTKRRKSKAYNKEITKITSWFNAIFTSRSLRKYNLVIPLLLTTLILSLHTMSLSLPKEVEGQALVSIEGYNLPILYDIYPGQDVLVKLDLSAEAFVKIALHLRFAAQGKRGSSWLVQGNFTGKHEWRITASGLSNLVVTVSSKSKPVIVEYYYNARGVPPHSLAVALASMFITIIIAGILWLSQRRSQEEKMLNEGLVRGEKRKPLTALAGQVIYELRALDTFPIVIPLLFLLVLFTNPAMWVAAVQIEMQINPEKTVATPDQEFFVFYAYVFHAFLIFLSVGLPLVLFSRLKERFKGRDVHERSYPISGPIFISARSIALFLVFLPSFLIFAVANIYLAEPFTGFKPNVPLLVLAIFLASVVVLGLLVLLAFLDWLFPQVYVQAIVFVALIVLVFSKTFSFLRLLFRLFGYEFTSFSTTITGVVLIEGETYVPWTAMILMTATLLLFSIGLSAMLLLVSSWLDTKVPRIKRVVSRLWKSLSYRLMTL